MNHSGENRVVLGHSSDAVRAFNRRLILNLTRTRQPLSRADLSRLSGLQRSTISLIVEELILERWILEGALAKLPRGRHPTSLRLNEDRVIIGADIRPAQITMGVGDVNGNFLTLETIPTPKDPRIAWTEQRNDGRSHARGEMHWSGIHRNGGSRAAQHGDRLRERRTAGKVDDHRRRLRDECLRERVFRRPADIDAAKPQVLAQ